MRHSSQTKIRRFGRKGLSVIKKQTRVQCDCCNHVFSTLEVFERFYGGTDRRLTRAFTVGGRNCANGFTNSAASVELNRLFCRV